MVDGMAVLGFFSSRGLISVDHADKLLMGSA